MEEQMVAGSGDLIIIRQLPIIEDRLDEAYLKVQERLSSVSSLVVTEDNYKDLKKTRADLNKEFNELENLRKKVKEAVEAPYKKFESGAYKRVADEYRGAIAELDGNIKDVEGGLKKKRQEELVAYFDEYRRSLGLDASIADPSKSGIKIGLSGSMKSLKDQVRGYLDKVNGDLAMIDTLDNADEVLAEYRVSLNVTEAVRVVNERHKRIEEERKRREAEMEARKQREEHEAEVDAAMRAQNEPESNFEEAVSVVSVRPEIDNSQAASGDNQILGTKYLGYEVHGTLEQLRGLKRYLQDALMEYCEMEGLNYGSC